MNRRNFFSLFGLAALTAIVRPKPKAHSILDLEPLDLGQLKPLTSEEKLQDSMLKGFYADAVRLPSHSYSINPNWIPCEGQWVMIGDKPMHYIHYTLE